MKPKVAIIHYTSPPVVGGVEAVMGFHTQLFRERGWEVTMLVGRDPNADPATLPPGVEILVEPLIDSKNAEINALNLELEQGIVSEQFSLTEQTIFQRFLALLAPFEVVIAHNAHTLHKNLALTSALVRFSQAMVRGELPADVKTKKMIAWCHDLAWTNPLYLPVLHNGYPWDLLRKPAEGTIYVTISDPRLVEFKQVFRPVPADVHVVPNGVSLNQFLNINAETEKMLQTTGLDKARLDDSMLLLFPSRITRRKNVEMAIKTVGEIKRSGQKVRLIVTGPPGPHNPRNDEYVQELLTLREKLGVIEEVVFLMERWANPEGTPFYVSHTMIADLYRYCDALFFPTSQEGFGIPILEAGMARMPIFCSAIPPLMEIAQNNAYYFSPIAHPPDVANLIIEKLETDPLFCLRQRVLRDFVWDNIFERKIKLLL